MGLSLFATTESWWADAECHDGTGRNASMFFAGQDTRGRPAPEDEVTAKEACARCPVASLCLEGAVERNERHGIWGGVNFGRDRDRKAFLRLRRNQAA